MANTKISALPSAATITGTEVVPLVQAGATVAATVQQLLALIVAGAPGNLDTFFETATQMGLDEATVTTLQTLVAGKASPSDVDAKIAEQAAADSATYPALDGSSRLAIRGTELDPTKIGATSIGQLFGSRKVAFCGDSITAGTGTTSSSLRYSTQSQRIAGSARAVEYVNGGVAGDRSDQLLARMPGILANSVDHAHIQIGTNDASQSVPLATYQANIRAIVALARAAGVTVTVGTVPPRGSVAGTTVDGFIRTYNLWLHLWCRRQGIALADTYAALADPTTGYYASGNDSGDGTHPSNAGHLAMAKVVGPYLAAAHKPYPWPVNAVSPIGLISNPLMNGTTGWADQGGTGTATTATVASTGYDELPAGAWLSYRINNTAGGSSVNRQTAATLDAAKYSPGDILMVCAWLNHSDTTTSASAKLQVTNGGTAFAIPLDTSNSVNNPGPILSTVTVPATPTTLKLGLSLNAPAGIDVTAFLGAVQVFNLTTGGLIGLA